MKHGILLLLAIGVVSCASPNKATKSEGKEGVTAPPAPVASEKPSKPSAPEVKETEKNRTYLCKNGEDERTIRHMMSGPHREGMEHRKCEVIYRKHNNSDVVAYAHHQGEYCTEVCEKIKSNLEGGGFRCDLISGQ